MSEPAPAPPPSGEAIAIAAPGPLRVVWQQRSLLRTLVLRDLRTRYVGSSVGVLWSVAVPLVQIGILTVAFSLVMQVRLGADSRVPFAVMLAWGLFPWLAIQEGVSRATTSLVDGSVLIKRMAFRPEILVLQPILAALAQELVALGLLAAVMPLLGADLAPTLPLVVIPLLLQVILTTGLGWILGVLHVYLRDTAQVVVVALQAWFYLTPIVYTLEVAPAGLRKLLSINPLCGIIESFRAFALAEPISWTPLIWSAVAAAGALLAGSYVMRRARAEIPDLI